jgi:flagellar biosynthesis protein FliR
VLAAATLGHLVLGAAGRMAPQLNLSSVGFSVSLLAGGLALFALAPTLVQLVAQHAMASFSHP